MIITQTPLRISFLGGGSDFPDYFRRHGGSVLTTAIDKYVYCIVKERFDEKIYVNYSIKEIVDSPDQLRHELVREAMRKTGVQKGIEISFLADVPAAGSGLGSSSAVTVGTLNALYHYVGYTPSAEQLAKQACEIEIETLKKPIGVQDQYITAYGGLRYLKFCKDGRVVIRRLEIDNGLLKDLESQLMLFFTGRTRKAEAVLREQKAKIKGNTKILKSLVDLARKGKDVLEKRRISQFGPLLDRGWALKKKMASKISDLQIDGLYQKAIKAGALGGKITGAGGGGFLLLFVPSQKRQAVRTALQGLRELPFGFEKDGSKVIFNVRRYY